MSDNLIDLDDEFTTSSKHMSINGINNTNGLIGKMAVTNNRARTPPRQDSFAGLTSLMRSKKPYTSTSTATPRSPLPSLGLVSNGLRFSSRHDLGTDMPSPMAKPYKAPESVASFLREQQEPVDSVFWSAASVPESTPDDTITLMSMTQTIAAYLKDDDSECDRLRRLSPSTRIRLTRPPTPADSAQFSPSGFRSDQEAVVRVTKLAWDVLTQELDTIKKQKQELENQLPVAKESAAILKDVNNEIDAELGLLKFQNDANKQQKADMGRALSEKEMTIKKQQLEIQDMNRKLGAQSEKDLRIKSQQAEIQAFHRRLGALKAKTNMPDTAKDVDYWRSIKYLKLQAAIDENDSEMADLKRIIENQEHSIETLTQQRDDARRAQSNSGDYVIRVQNLKDTLAQREKLIADLRNQLVAEKLKVTQLEDELEDLLARSNQADIEDLKTTLHETTSTCDRQRNQLKLVKAENKQYEARILELTEKGVLLRGAAHLVPPARDEKLPETVISCMECYSKDLPCDNLNKCRACTENNTVCKRFMCSLKRRNKFCHLVPCDLTHDSQGWLMLPRPRPEW